MNHLSDNAIELRRQHFEAGLRCSREGQLDEGIKEYQAAIEVDRSFSEP